MYNPNVIVLKGRGRDRCWNPEPMVQFPAMPSFLSGPLRKDP